MATFLDVTGLAEFSKLFVFILVLVVVYAILAYSKLLGGSKAIAWLIAFILAILVVVSPLATGAIAYISPWFVLVFVFIGFISVALKMFGATSTEIESYASLKWILLVAVVIIFVVGFLSYIRDRTLLPGDNETSTDVSEYAKSSIVIFHPTILGAIMILIIAVFTIALLAGKVK